MLAAVLDFGTAQAQASYRLQFHSQEHATVTGSLPVQLTISVQDSLLTPEVLIILM